MDNSLDSGESSRLVKAAGGNSSRTAPGKGSNTDCHLTTGAFFCLRLLSVAPAAKLPSPPRSDPAESLESPGQEPARQSADFAQDVRRTRHRSGGAHFQHPLEHLVPPAAPQNLAVHAAQFNQLIDEGVQRTILDVGSKSAGNGQIESKSAELSVLIAAIRAERAARAAAEQNKAASDAALAAFRKSTSE